MKKRGSIGVFVVAACATCALAPAALAATVDQQQLDGSGGSDAITSVSSAAQIFTAGASGGVGRVDLYLAKFGAPSAPLRVDIQDVSAGSPGTTVLGSGSLPVSAVTGAPAFVSVNLTSPASVVAGTQYAIVAYSQVPPGNNYAWSTAAALNTYAGGDPFTSPSSPATSGPWGPFPAYDFAFKTYIGSGAAGPTGQRAAALKKCKKKRPPKARKKCRKKAARLPL
jgi:hypothetical protein